MLVKEMSNKDKTEFMNRDSYSEEQIKQYPYSERKEYLVYTFSEEIGEETDDVTVTDNPPIRVYATDDFSAMEYIRTKFNMEYVLEVSEQIRTFRPIYGQK